MKCVDLMKKFTLIELLVIVGIIAILLTILLPSLSKARDKAETAICASNQAQVYRGAVIWSKKHNNWLPFGWRQDKYKFAYGMTWGVGNGTGSPVERPVSLGWVVRDEILSEPNVFYCPDGPYEYDETAWNSLTSGNYSNTTRVRSGYTLNAGLQYLKPGHTPTLESGPKLLLSQIGNRAVMTDVVNWGVPHTNLTVTTYSDGHVNLVKSPLLNPNGIGNNATDWSQLWLELDAKY